MKHILKILFIWIITSIAWIWIGQSIEDIGVAVFITIIGSTCSTGLIASWLRD